MGCPNPRRCFFQVSHRVAENERVQQGVEKVQKGLEVAKEKGGLFNGVSHELCMVWKDATDRERNIASTPRFGLFRKAPSQSFRAKSAVEDTGKVVMEKTQQGIEAVKEKTREWRAGAGTVWEQGGGVCFFQLCPENFTY